MHRNRIFMKREVINLMLNCIIIAESITGISQGKEAIKTTSIQIQIAMSWKSIRCGVAAAAVLAVLFCCK